MHVLLEICKLFNYVCPKKRPFVNTVDWLDGWNFINPPKGNVICGYSKLQHLTQKYAKTDLR